jgi:hypothetical protein
MGGTVEGLVPHSPLFVFLMYMSKGGRRESACVFRTHFARKLGRGIREG